jgi:hypothetical protein
LDYQQNHNSKYSLFQKIVTQIIEYSIIKEKAKENEENTLFPKVFKENHKKQVGRFKPEKVGNLNRK